MLITVEEVEDENDSETEAMEEDREVDESQKDDGSENSEQEEADLSTLLNDDTSVSQQVSNLGSHRNIKVYLILLVHLIISVYCL